MITEYLKTLNISGRLELCELSDLISTNFYYEEERSLVILKTNEKVIKHVSDFKIALSKVGIKFNVSDFREAMDSETLIRKRWLDYVVDNLEPWDGSDRITTLANHFKLTNDSEREIFNKTFAFWVTKTAEMIVNPYDENAVNRLVFCIQSEAQGIGKTTFARKLCKAFDNGVEPAYYEMDNADFVKDSRIEMAKKTIILLDDINNWKPVKLKGIKSIISSKYVQVRAPYGRLLKSKPRTASFIGTTNESAFLNESNNTRWAVFSISDIDKSYNNIDLRQLWSQAFKLAEDPKNVLFTDELKEYAIRSSTKNNTTSELDTMVAQCFELTNDSNSSKELLISLPEESQELVGSNSIGASKLSKSFTRVFGKDYSYYRNGGLRWRLRLKKT